MFGRPLISEKSAELPVRGETGPPDGAASVISNDLSVVGEPVRIVSLGTLVIEGTVHGEINGRDIVIGHTGSVAGSITAQSIAVHGTVNGSLTAAAITLYATAHVEGDLLQSALVVIEGAHFNGNLRHARNAAEITPDLNRRTAAA